MDERLNGMCDYSLAQVNNRLANEGETLHFHRFSTGSLGLTDTNYVEAWSKYLRKGPAAQSWAQRFWKYLNPPAAPCELAVCIPPGAKLQLNGIPARIQRDYGLKSVEEVTFTQIEVTGYRDAVRFSSGRLARLQELREGMTVKVLSLDSLEESTEVTLERIATVR